jgi:FtsZ-binding cell division protein ZapB
MVSLEQVKLLESKVTNTIEYVKKVTGENSKLKEKLNSYQKRIEELEVLVQQFKENQGRIEDGILSALDRLNQFEDALESNLSTENKLPKDDKLPAESKPSTENKPSIESKPAKETKAPDKAADEGKTSDTTKEELDIF